MESATWYRTPAAASAARTLRPEVSKNSSTAWSSHEGELARSITTCVPAMASLRPSPVMVLTPVSGEAATTSWPPLRRMATVLEPIRPVPPITTIFIANLLDQTSVGLHGGLRHCPCTGASERHAVARQTCGRAAIWVGRRYHREGPGHRPPIPLTNERPSPAPRCRA